MVITLYIYSVHEQRKDEWKTIIYQFQHGIRARELKSWIFCLREKKGTFNQGIILTESNYDVWSQLVEMYIVKREKLSYIRVKTNPPKESEDVYEKCYAENQKVKRWLLMSMSPEIMKRYLRLPTAQEI